MTVRNEIIYKFGSLCFAQERVSRELLCTLGFWPLCLSISGRHFCLLALPIGSF